jgi:hypothetical protein
MHVLLPRACTTHTHTNTHIHDTQVPYPRPKTYWKASQQVQNSNPMAAKFYDTEVQGNKSFSDHSERARHAKKIVLQHQVCVSLCLAACVSVLLYSSRVLCLCIHEQKHTHTCTRAHTNTHMQTHTQKHTHTHKCARAQLSHTHILYTRGYRSNALPRPLGNSDLEMSVDLHLERASGLRLSSSRLHFLLRLLGRNADPSSSWSHESREEIERKWRSGGGGGAWACSIKLL